MQKRYFDPKPCVVCGNLFSPFTRNKYDADQRQTCSKECYYALLKEVTSRPRKKARLLTCKNCGREFKTYPSRKDKKFCDMKCQREYEESRRQKKQFTRVCINCGITFNVPIRRPEQKYCSHSCYLSTIHGDNHPNWRGGFEKYYGPDWKEQSQKARERDSFTCQFCGKSQDDEFRELSVHHIKPFRDFGIENYQEANDLNNLITLCQSCHMKLEHDKIELP